MSDKDDKKTFAEILGIKGKGSPIRISKRLREETLALNNIAVAITEGGEAAGKLDRTLYNQ